MSSITSDPSIWLHTDGVLFFSLMFLVDCFMLQAFGLFQKLAVRERMEKKLSYI